MAIEQQAIEMAESFLNRSWHELENAKSDFKYRRYAEAISAAGQCIELSLKAAFLLLGEEYPKRHYFTDDEAENLLQKGPKELEYTMSSPDCLSFLNFGRISTPWLNMAMKISYWRREAV